MEREPYVVASVLLAVLAIGLLFYASRYRRNLIAGYESLKALLWLLRLSPAIALWTIYKVTSLSTYLPAWALYVCVAVALLWALSLREPHYSLARRTFWFAEVFIAPRMSLGDSYKVALRLRPRAITHAGGATGAGVPIAMYAPTILPVAFREDPPQVETKGELELQRQPPFFKRRKGTDKLLTVRVNAPAFTAEPKESTLLLRESNKTDFVSFIVLPKTAGRHELQFEFLSTDGRVGEVSIRVNVKQFLWFRRFGLSDNQMRALQFITGALALAASIIALLKAFHLL